MSIAVTSMMDEGDAGKAPGGSAVSDEDGGPT